jgi:hypothetical protein
VDEHGGRPEASILGLLLVPATALLSGIGRSLGLTR